MTERQRRAHRLIWLVLGPLLVVLATAGVMLRPDLPVQDPPPGAIDTTPETDR